jgi:hypothetical protein
MSRAPFDSLARLALAGVLTFGAMFAAVAEGTPRGQVNAAPFEKFATDDGEVVEVNLSGSLLRALGQSFKDEDPEATRIVSKLESVRAIVVEIAAARYNEAAQVIESTAKDLVGKGWEEIAKVRSKTERIRVLVLNDGGKIAGLVVMLIDRDDESGNPDLVFANIAGTLDFSEIERISEHFDVSGLDQIPDGASIQKN